MWPKFLIQGWKSAAKDELGCKQITVKQGLVEDRRDSFHRYAQLGRTADKDNNSHNAADY